MTFRQKLIVVIAAGLAVVISDQITKIWARGALVAPERWHLPDTFHKGKKRNIEVIGDRPGVEFRLSFNKGSAFGLFSGTPGARVFLSIIGIGALFLIFYLLRRPESDSKLFVWALALVSGGAVGNLIDRIAFGQVTDFILVWLTNSVGWLWPWPAFNIADMALVVGVGMMMVTIILAPPEDEGKERDEDGDDKKAAPKASKSPKKGKKGKKGKKSRR